MKKFQNITDKIAPSIIITVLLIIWQILSMVNIIPKFMLPSPFEVVKAFVYDFPLLMEHTKITLLEAFLGLGLGIIILCWLLLRQYLQLRLHRFWYFGWDMEYYQRLRLLL